MYWLVWKGSITIFDHFWQLGAGGGVKIELRGSICLKFRGSVILFIFLSTDHQNIKTIWLLKFVEETMRFHNQVPHIGMFLSFLSILQNVFLKTNEHFNVNPIGGGRAKNPVLFFFTYVHPGLKIIFFVNSYLLVMAYKGLVSIFLYLSPFWTLLFSLCIWLSAISASRARVRAIT